MQRRLSPHVQTEGDGLRQTIDDTLRGLRLRGGNDSSRSPSPSLVKGKASTRFLSCLWKVVLSASRELADTKTLTQASRTSL